MKLIPGVLFSMLLGLCTEAASIEGEITLPFSKSSAKGTSLVKEFGDIAKVTSRCRVSEFFGWETVIIEATVTNTGSNTMWGQWCVAFYDKNKALVGTAAQTFTARDGLKPGKSKRLAAARIVLPRDKYKEIVAYQAVVYGTETPPLPRRNSILLEDPDPNPRAP